MSKGSSIRSTDEQVHGFIDSQRALIAFTALTGMRDSAIASVRLKHINLNQNPIMILQEPDQIKTKFSKQIFSHFLPVGDDIQNVMTEWLSELREKMCYSQNDPVFPRTKLVHDENQSFIANGLEPICWSTTTPIRKIFKQAFLAVGLPYFNPHRFRDTLAHLGLELCHTPEEFKASSQSLCHSSPLTTFTSYGNIDPHRQGTILNSLENQKAGPDQRKAIEQIKRLMKQL